MSRSKRAIILEAIHSYADPQDPDSPCDCSNTVVRVIEFLETFAGLDLEACIPLNKTKTVIDPSTVEAANP